MASWEKELEVISDLEQRIKLTEAEDRMRRLIEKLSDKHVLEAEAAIQGVINAFLPRRRRALTAALSDRVSRCKLSSPTSTRNVLGSAPAQQSDDVAGASHARSPVRHDHAATGVPPGKHDSAARMTSFLGHLRTRLRELSGRYIFQWSTWYRDLIGEVYDNALPLIQACPDDESLANHLEDAFAKHAEEIFTKGYDYKKQQFASSGDPVVISLHGLQRFLDLPLTSYIAKTTNTTEIMPARAARKVCSGLLSGIIQGYGHTQFGDRKGWKILPAYLEKWIHCLAFLTPDRLDQITRQAESAELRFGLENVVQPIIEAINRLIQEAPEGLSMLPRIGQYAVDAQRLEIALELPQPGERTRYFDIHCYPFREEVGRSQLEESADRRVMLVAVVLQPDLQEWVDKHDWLRQVVIDAGGDARRVSARAFEHLKLTLSRLAGPDAWDAPLTHNFARDFPLTKPHLQKYFRVYRTTIRDLLRSFEHGTGIRLWCSVRRSGKTTAGFDLSSSTGTAVVATQSCEPTGQHPEEDLFIEEVRRALDCGVRLPRYFVRDTITRCAGPRANPGKKIIFVLDEYETLFNEMRLALDKKYEEAREYVVKPLLNQLVEFSRDNLVLLIGMQPNAHNILMDQNQLSPSVQQDAFPLFEHDPGAEASEFVLLLKRVLGNHVTAAPSFVDQLHAETGGHPFLTVNLLIDFFDWLIASKRPAAGMVLTLDDFWNFAAARLTFEAIRQCKEYDFFRDFLSSALETQCRKRHPWLFAVCTVMLQLARQEPRTMAYPKNRFAQLLKDLHLPDGWSSPDHLLRTGQQANFLSLQGDTVRPRIPIMARIALASC